MTLRLLSLIIITLLTVACSKRITDPCVGIEPITQVNLESENILCFVSTDSYDLDYRDKKSIVINAQLYLPEIESQEYNAVIMTHGSGGKRRYHKKCFLSFF